LLLLQNRTNDQVRSGACRCSTASAGDLGRALLRHAS